MFNFRNRRAVNGFAVLLWAAIVVVMVVGLPLAAHSAWHQIIVSTTRSYAYTLLSPQPSGEQLHLVLAFNELDAVNNTVGLSITGYRTCRRGCRYQDTLLIAGFPENAQWAPRTEKVSLPADTALFTERIILPITGAVRYYPFGHYALNIGLAVERRSGSDIGYLRPDRDPFALELKVDEDMPGLQFSLPPTLIDADLATPPALVYPYLIVCHAEFERPFYIKFFIILILLLFTIATLYTLINTTFDKIIISTGSIIFGLWATRTIVLGNLPPYVTFMDLVLGLLMAGVLLSLAVHATRHYYKRFNHVE